jgi:hypothetical protein
MIISFQQWREVEGEGDFAAPATAPTTTTTAPIDARIGMRDAARHATSIDAPALYAIISIIKELAVKDRGSFGLVINTIKNGLSRLEKSPEEVARLTQILGKATSTMGTAAVN